MLVLAPVMCILSGIGVSQVLSTYMKNLDISRPDKKSKKQQDSTYPIKNEVSTRLAQEDTWSWWPHPSSAESLGCSCRLPAG